MKTIKLTFSIIVIAVLTCSNNWGQTIHTEATCNMDNYDMGYPAGIVSGYIVYHFTIRVSKETGKIESLHWVAKDCNLVNTNGDVVKSIDAGHDTYGVLWDFFNRPNYWNSVLYSDKVTYNVEDGWWDNIMPAEIPSEGAFIGMAFKIICNGNVGRFYAMAQLHRNSSGEITASVIKP